MLIDEIQEKLANIEIDCRHSGMSLEELRRHVADLAELLYELSLKVEIK